MFSKKIFFVLIFLLTVILNSKSPFMAFETANAESKMLSDFDMTNAKIIKVLEEGINVVPKNSVVAGVLNVGAKIGFNKFGYTGAEKFVQINYNGNWILDSLEMPKFETASAVGSGDYDYGVIATYDRDGEMGSEIYKLSGYAWTQAGVYMKFDGTEIEIPSMCDFDAITANDCAYCAEPANAEDPCCIAAEEEGLCCNITPNKYTCDICEADSSSACCKNLIRSGACDDICTISACLCSDEPLCIDVGGAGAGDLGVDKFPIPRVADGADGYYIHLFLQDENRDPADIETFAGLSLDLNWDDTVRTDQVVDGEDSNANDFDAVTKIGEAPPLTKDDFGKVAPGHYVSTNKITSIAPTTDGNNSDGIASTDEFEPFSNVKYILRQVCGGDIESRPEKCIVIDNNLILEDVDYSFGTEPDVVSGNVNLEKSLPFKPAFELDALYQGVEKRDYLTAMRDIPIDIWLSARENEPVPANTDSPVDTQVDLEEVEVQTTLGHDKENSNYIECMNAVAPRTRGGPLVDDVFALYFEKNENTFYDSENFANASSGSILSNPNDEDGFINGNHLIQESIDDGNGNTIINQIGSKALKFTFDDLGILPEFLKGVATFIPSIQAGVDGGFVQPVETCQFIPAPSLYSMIGYNVNDKDVKYYSNQLPREGKCFLENPSADIRGNVYSQTDLSPTAGVRTYATTKDAISNLVKNTILSNVKRYGGDFSTVPSGGESCIITALSVVDGVSGCSSSDYKLFTMADETVLYFDNKDVHIKLADPEEETKQWTGGWSVVTNGGNIYIDNDLYDYDKVVDISRFAKERLGLSGGGAYKLTDGVSNELSFVALAKESESYGEGGNIFISDKIRDIQAVLFADHSVLTSVSSVSADDNTAEFADKDSFENFYRTLSNVSVSSNQLSIQGAVSSQNTIGGGPDLFRKSGYMLKGTGEEILGSDEQKNKYVGMYYDWNYFRMFSVCGDFCSRMPRALEKVYKDANLCTSGDVITRLMYDLSITDRPDAEKYFYGTIGDPNLDLSPVHVLYVKPKSRVFMNIRY